jgi:rhamnulose-1-phosphate aldolase
MALSNTAASWFVSDMVKITSDAWLKGWDERNGGNVSFRLLEQDVAPYLAEWRESRILPLDVPLPELAEEYFLVTGSGKYFRNVQLNPEANLGVIRVVPGGAAVAVCWGYSDGAVPTSELSAHLKSHVVRQRLAPEKRAAIVHCHATNLIALSYVLAFTTDNVTRALWEGSTECLVVFPEGVGTIPWMVPGTDAIGDATAEQMKRHTLVLWQYHGIFGTGETPDEAFGLIDTAEKAADILMRVLAAGGPRQTMSHQNLIDLAARFNVTPLASAMALDGWKLADRPAPAAPTLLRSA